MSSEKMPEAPEPDSIASRVKNHPLTPLGLTMATVASLVTALYWDTPEANRLSRELAAKKEAIMGKIDDKTDEQVGSATRLIVHCKELGDEINDQEGMTFPAHKGYNKALRVELECLSGFNSEELTPKK